MESVCAPSFAVCRLCKAPRSPLLEIRRSSVAWGPEERPAPIPPSTDRPRDLGRRFGSVRFVGLGRSLAAALQEEILGNANKAGQMARLLAWELHHRAPIPPVDVPAIWGVCGLWGWGDPWR